MIRAVANQKIDLSREEYEYYLELEKAFGKEAFHGLFSTNKQGQITTVLPNANSPTPMILIFFFLNVMFNQKLRRLEHWIDHVKNLEERLEKLEKFK